MARGGQADFSLRRVLTRAAAIIVAGSVILAALPTVYGGWVWWTQVRRTTPVYDPPVLAGQVVSAGCSGGVYARTGDGRIVITTTGHCMAEGQRMFTLDGRFVGVASAPSRWAVCDRPGKDRCTSSDMAYVSLAPEMIPWGRLDQIDMGAGGYRTVAPGTRALSCDDISVGQRVEHDGNAMYRTGTVLSKQANDWPSGDGVYMPCIVIADAAVTGGDSGGVVLVDSVPGGVTARAFGADGPGPQRRLGFTPLGPGLAEMGLEMCDTPDCGLSPASAANR
jgi:hypothetical protein